MQKIIVNGILEKKWEIFLAQRSDNKKIAPWKYHLPGWHVDFWETCEQALIREYKEEFNLDIETWKVIKTFSYIHDWNHIIGIFYNITCDNIPDTIWFDEKETKNTVWVSNNKYLKYVTKDWLNDRLIKYYLNN